MNFLNEMNYLQQIRINTDKDIDFDCFIISTNNSSPFRLEIMSYKRDLNPWSGSLCVENGLSNADLAYEKIINYCKQCSFVFNASIIKIDNPVGTPFVCEKHQNTIIKNKGLNIKILVEGK